MSLEDLEKMGVLLNEKYQGKLNLSTTVNKPLLIGIGTIVVVSACMMYFGDGNLITWIGVALFLMNLLVFTWHSLRAVDEQREESEKIKAEIDAGKFGD